MLTTALAAHASAHLAHEEPIELAPIVVTGDLWESELQNTTVSVSVLDEPTPRATAPNTSKTSSTPCQTSPGRPVRCAHATSSYAASAKTHSSKARPQTLSSASSSMTSTSPASAPLETFSTRSKSRSHAALRQAHHVNAAGGVIRIVSNEPTSTGLMSRPPPVKIASSLEASPSEDHSLRVTRGTYLPLPPTASNKMDSATTALASAMDTNERNELNTRLKVRWTANDDWQWDGTVPTPTPTTATTSGHSTTHASTLSPTMKAATSKRVSQQASAAAGPVSIRSRSPRSRVTPIRNR